LWEGVGGGKRTLRRSYLTADDGPVQQSVSNGLITDARSHCCDEATPRSRNRAISWLLAVAEGGSEMVKAAVCPSFPRSWLDCSAVAPSKMTTSCEASVLSELVKRGAGSLPNAAMWPTAASASALGMSRRSLPYRCLDVCAGVSTWEERHGSHGLRAHPLEQDVARDFFGDAGCFGRALRWRRLEQVDVCALRAGPGGEPGQGSRC
jgi:hypothetical protein